VCRRGRSVLAPALGRACYTNDLRCDVRAFG
jgi:hypothetical protein